MEMGLNFDVLNFECRKRGKRHCSCFMFVSSLPSQAGRSWVVPTRCISVLRLDPSTLSTPASSQPPRRTPSPWQPHQCPPPLHQVGAIRGSATPRHPTLSLLLLGSRPRLGMKTAKVPLHRRVEPNNNRDVQQRGEKETLSFCIQI